MIGETVTHITPGVQTGTDRYGKPVYSEVSTDIDNVAVAPTQSVIDPQTGYVTEKRGYTLFLPSDTTAAAGDRFTVREKTYAVAGSSSDWVSPYTSRAPGNVVILEDTEYVA